MWTDGEVRGSRDDRKRSGHHRAGRNEAAARQVFVDGQPNGRLGMTEKITGRAVYLASDESACTTGSIHIAESGFSL
jgi:2-keto-3-deoxy-L-fuconate dehydrogenase